MVALNNCLIASPAIVIGIVVLVAGIIDVRKFRVPDVLTVPLVVSGLLFHLLLHGMPGFAQSLAGVGMALLILTVFYVVGAVGAGDVKLLAGVGAWLGAEAVLWVFSIAGLSAGVYSLVLLGLSRRLSAAFVVPKLWVIQILTLLKYMALPERVENIVDAPDRRRRLVPFALMVAIGLAVVLVGEHCRGVLEWR